MATWRMLLWSIFVLLAFISTSSQENKDTVPLGSYITAASSSSSWLSPSGEFAFGFHRLDTGLFLVGIWFDKIPQKTLVWSANRDDPVQTGSQVNLTLNGQLVLTDSKGKDFVLYNGTSTSYAAMQDDGNFVLRNSSSGVLWQSFDSPTDTILPGQVLVMGQKLFSNANGTTDYSTGKYRLEMQMDGNVVLSAYRTTDLGYWNAQTINNVSVRLVFNKTAPTLFIVNGSSIIYNMTANLPSSVQDYYHKATITDKGDFQQLFHSKGNGTGWDVAWKAVTQPCTVNNICGVYGFCQSPDNKEINCSCLPGYSPRDQNNPSVGCYPNEVKDFCDPNSSPSDIVIQRIANADFPNRDYAELERVFQADEEICKQHVLNDCLCEAAVLIGSTCFKKRMPIQNARSVVPDTDNMIAFLKISNSMMSKSKNHSVSEGVLLAGVIVCSILAPLFAAVAVYYHPFVRRYRHAKNPPKRKPIELNLRAFSFQQLHKATDGFSNKLGQGASGAVYAGILELEDEEVEVAVKKLENGTEHGGEDKEFLAEVKVIGLTHHKNLVRLLGFCNEKNYRLLVYELMKNGSVSSFLFQDGHRPSWKLRSDIVIGIARGLLYLHDECENQIIHCDIKPQNVLLDQNYTAKIADFGLAKLLMKDQTRTNTDFRGTMGYMAPEWLKNVPVTTKVDIYSFGVLLLEIIFCLRHMNLHPVGEANEEFQLILVDWVLHCVRKEMLRTVVSDDEEILCEFHNFERMTMVGLWCLCPEPNLRPSAVRLVQMLEGTIEVGVPPMVDTNMY